MSVLVLINGLPGSGKSTLAREFARRHPGAVALDIDVLRSMIGGWRRDPEAAGRQARSMALAVAGDQLAAGHPVLVPQLLARAGFIDRLAALAAAAEVRFVETVIDAPLPLCRRRFSERAASPAGPAEAEAQVWLAPDDDAGWAELQQRLAQLAARRRGTIRLPVTAALEALEAAV